MPNLTALPSKWGLDVSGDHHIHTSLCNHATGNMEEYVLAAINRGLKSMTFLEHLECGIRYNHRIWLTRENFAEYFQEGLRLKKKYRKQITVRLGAEVGYNPAAVTELRTLLSSFPFEHIGLSYHFYFNGSQHLNMVSSSPDNMRALTAAGCEQVMDDYFNGLIRACTILPCDKVCHLDAVLRHIPNRTFTAQQRELINQLLILMRKKKIALELNTSGYAMRSQPWPAAEIVEQALGLDIQLIAGSDAHRPNQVGRYFDLFTPASPD
jgi:histidinol-phosphatase (PHP family)